MTSMINSAKSCERDNRTDELTEIELSGIAGGSQSTGAGAGKVTFNSFSITKHVDKASPVFFL